MPNERKAAGGVWCQDIQLDSHQHKDTKEAALEAVSRETIFT